MNESTTVTDDLKIPLSRSLLALRLGVFIVMLMWTLDKFVNPDHAAKVYSKFYGIEWLSQNFSYIVGVAELLLVLAFVVGLWKRYTYGAILLLHAVSTFSTYKLYLDPFNNLLFFAAWPMFAGCLALYWLRGWDTLLTIDSVGKE